MNQTDHSTKCSYITPTTPLNQIQPIDGVIRKQLIKIDKIELIKMIKHKLINNKKIKKIDQIFNSIHS